MEDSKEKVAPQEAPVKSAAKTQSVAEMEAEIKRIELETKKAELEAKKLEVLEKQANVEDIKERLAERQLKRENIRQTSITNGTTLRQIKEDDLKVQRRCNHRKGGNGAAGVIGGKGDSLNYAVIKHIMMNGDMWVRCQRCGKTWKPPLKEDYKTVEEYMAAVAEYERAKELPTTNQTSSAYQYRWSDNGAYSRQVLRHTTLR